jgi:hypothetical protein
MGGDIVIQLSKEDILTVEQILIDSDRELALKFIRDKIEPAIKAGQAEPNLFGTRSNQQLRLGRLSLANRGNEYSVEISDFAIMILLE